MSYEIIDSTDDDLLAAWDKIAAENGFQKFGNIWGDGNIVIKMSQKDWNTMLSICECWADEKR